MKVNIISINSITAIPILRYIVHFFIDNMKAEIELVEVHVKSFNNYYKDIPNLLLNHIAVYDSINDFRKQKAFSKISKYLKIISKTFSIYNSKEKQFIYCCDYQVLFLVFIVMSFFKTKKVIIIYHQFELIEKTKLDKLNRFFYNYVLKKINTIDLAIFPEVNRLNYFLTESNLSKDKTFILPNTCETVAFNHNIEKHPLFNPFPSNSFIVAHLGNVGGSQHYFSNFIAAIEKMENYNNIIFLFLGRKNSEIEKIIANKSFKNLVFIDSIPHEELIRVYPFIDLGVILYKGTGLNYEYCAPNKLYELWANGVPVIGHHLKGLSSLFNCEEKGVLTNFEDIESIINTVLKFSKNSTINKASLIKKFKDEISISNYFKLLQPKLKQLLKQ